MSIPPCNRVRHSPNASVDEAVTPVFRQTAASPGTPGGADPCLDLIQEIIELLNEVARRINNALDDKFDLFKYRPGPNPERPDAGTWDGHRDRFYYDRDRLRHKIAEWESNDDCRGYRLNEEQQEELKEAEDFREKEFPEKPATSLSKMHEGESVWVKLRKYLPEIIVSALIALGAVAAGLAIAACFASGACEFGLALAGLGVLLVVGITAALRAAGVQDKSSSGSVASSIQPRKDKNQTA